MKKSRSVINFSLLTCLFSFLFACEADNEYSTWPCRFAYDNSTHQDATLASAMDVNVPGIFCMISESVRGGVKYLTFKNNHNDASSLAESEEEKRAGYILGLNNGIIVGFQNAVLDDYGNAKFMAYDVQCPNCVRQYNNTLSPSYGVSMNDNGIATCGKCGRKYDLNNGGILQNGQDGDSGLEKYAASTTGPFGYISAFRHR